MSIKALQDYTFVKKYAGYIPDKSEEVHKMIDWAYDMIS